MIDNYKFTKKIVIKMWRGFYIYFYLTVRDNSGNNSARYTYYYKETKHDFEEQNGVFLKRRKTYFLQLIKRKINFLNE